MHNLIQHIQNYVPLSNEQADQLPRWFRTLELKKRDFLLKEGQICNATYFVSKGCLRMYTVTESGIEQITQFAIENWWLADYFSINTSSPSTFYIQTIEPSRIIELPNSSEEELFRELPQMERYFRLVIQRAYAAYQLRIKFLYEYSREELYQNFVSDYPEFIQRIPQYMLASFLGFTPEYLSELRKKIR